MVILLPPSLEQLFLVDLQTAVRLLILGEPVASTTMSKPLSPADSNATVHTPDLCYNKFILVFTGPEPPQRKDQNQSNGKPSSVSTNTSTLSVGLRCICSRISYAAARFNKKTSSFLRFPAQRTGYAQEG